MAKEKQEEKVEVKVEVKDAELEMRIKKVKAAFKTKKVKIHNLLKQDARRATMMEPVKFDPEGMDMATLTRNWNNHKVYSYPLKTPVELTQFAINQLKQTYTSAPVTTGDELSGEVSTQQRYLIEEA